MALLHSALQILSPTPFSSIPTEDAQARDYVLDVFTKSQLILDSVPLPAAEDLAVPAGPPSDTLPMTASSVSEIFTSSARSEPINPSHVDLQKEWGKPIKLAAKDNPLNIAVYKLSGKDGKGAWFARRSVHEGLSFRRWKLGLEQEFPESLAVQGGPGEGNIRGIGGEKRVEQKNIAGVGKVEVYHLSAQFPGPTTPRDFVTLLISSESALSYSEKQNSDTSRNHPRHFMIVSKPCIHPECPTRDGFIRGQYESVEFIREISREPKRSASNLDLRRAETDNHVGATSADERALSSSSEAPSASRKRGKTVSFMISGAAEEHRDTPIISSDDAIDNNPIEWIMVTRSDPGGSVPRFMVERGTPGGIVADASKFLDWACKKEHDEPLTKSEGTVLSEADDPQARTIQGDPTNGSLAGPEDSSSTSELPQEATAPSRGIFNSIATMAKQGLDAYTPQFVVDQFNSNQDRASVEQSAPNPHAIEEPDDASSISGLSFASAEEGYEDDSSTKSTSSRSMKNPGIADQSAHEKELIKLQERKKALNAKFAKSREKELKDKEELTSKELERLRKAEERHQRQIEKQEEKYKKEIAKLEARRTKEAAKEEARRKRELDKDEKARLTRERDEMKEELEVMRKERDVFREQVGALQRENTSLVARLGKMNEGRSVLKEVQAEIANESRSRSNSIRRSKEMGSGVEATILAGDTEKSSPG